MKFITLFFLMIVCMQVNALEILRSKYPWPQEKPQVQPDSENMFCNEKELKPLLNESIKLIVELGSWLGGSTRFFLDNVPQATIIAVDHWRGSSEHHQFPYWAQKLPTLYETFLVNCWNYRERLIPLRMTTLEGLHEIHAAGLKPDLIYIDAGHDYASVKEDLEKAYALFPHARIFGDDWSWFLVSLAVRQFCLEHKLQVFAEKNLWCITA